MFAVTTSSVTALANLRLLLIEFASTGAISPQVAIFGLKFDPDFMGLSVQK
jgi:hypothetical protein